MIIESVLTETQCKVPSESPVYNELLRYVKAHFPLPENSTATQAAIFSLAYTFSCHTKKIRIDGEYKSNASSEEKKENDIAIRAIVSSLRGADEYETLCTEAQRFFEKLNNVAYQKLFNDLDSALSAKVAPLAEAIQKNSVKEREDFWRQSLKFIFLESPKHAALLVAGGLWLTLLAWGISSLAPHVANKASNVVEEAFHPFIKDERSKSSNTEGAQH